MKNQRRFYSFPTLVSLTTLLFLFACKTSPPSAPADTAPSVRITSPSSGEVCRLTDTVYVDATDDKAVTKVELYINGSLAGTDESAPWRFIWNTEQWDDGDYALTATAYDGGGHSTISDAVTMSISNAFPVTFINTTHTAVSVTVLSVTRTVQVNDSTVYLLSTNPRSLVFNASTSGKTSGGSTIGLTLTWGGSSNPLNVTNYTYARLILQVSTTYFFMYMSNTGKTTLGPVYVNYGLSDQTVDYISIPGDGIKYSIGYYKVHSNSQVRAYWSSPTTTYSYWTLPFSTVSINQSLWLSNSLPTSKIVGLDGGYPDGAAGTVSIGTAPSTRRWNTSPTSRGTTIFVPSND